jgi:hypothetical protein
MGLIVAGLIMDSDLFRQGRRGPLVQDNSRAKNIYKQAREMFFHPLAPQGLKKKL